jgi:predicted nucleic acid-binding protein
LLARAENAGSAVGGSDALIAATATVHGLQVVTRNVSHLRATGVDVMSPWQNRLP